MNRVKSEANRLSFLAYCSCQIPQVRKDMATFKTRLIALKIGSSHLSEVEAARSDGALDDDSTEVEDAKRRLSQLFNQLAETMEKADRAYEEMMPLQTGSEDLREEWPIGKLIYKVKTDDEVFDLLTLRLGSNDVGFALMLEEDTLRRGGN